MLYLIFPSLRLSFKNILWHDKQPFALHFTTCKRLNQSPQSSVEPFSRKGLTIPPFSCFLPLDSQRSLPFPGSGKLVPALELNCRHPFIATQLLCMLVCIAWYPLLHSKAPRLFSVRHTVQQLGCSSPWKSGKYHFFHTQNGEADVPPPHGFAC